MDGFEHADDRVVVRGDLVIESREPLGELKL